VLKRVSDLQYHTLFRKRASYHYDTWFSYRFLWQMRNYIQHCGLPLGGIERRLVSDADGKPKTECFVYFDKEKLLSTYGSWGKIQSEIENLPDKIDIMINIEQLSLASMKSLYIPQK
jgi:hypothetical protein